MTRCSTIRTLLTKRFHEALTSEDAFRLEQHLQACAACRSHSTADAAFERGLRSRIAAGALAGPAVRMEPGSVVSRMAERRRAAPTGAWGAAVLGLVAAAGAAALAMHFLHVPVSRKQDQDAAPVEASTPRPLPHHPAVPPSKRTPPRQRPTLEPHQLAVLPRQPAILPEPPLQPATKARPVDDNRYLDGRDAGLLAHWTLGRETDPQVLAWSRRPLPAAKDDFVQIPLPRVASVDPRSPAVAAAVREYEEEAKVVDARLFRKVNLKCKAEPLEEICRQLSEQTGVKIEASRGVRDEKATVLLEDRAARDVMREIARLFGYAFARTGDPNAYRYELVQDLRSQLAEEEMRNRDNHEALIALDEKMAEFRPYLNRNLDDLLQRVEADTEGKKPETQLLYRFVKGGGWGPAQLYFRLSPQERTALFAGQELRFTPNDGNPERRLPAEWRDTILKSTGLHLYGATTITENFDKTRPSTPVNQVQGLEPDVTMELKRSEAGVLSLWVGTHVMGAVNDVQTAGGSTWEMAAGRSPSTAKPENAKANAALAKDPTLQPKIDLEPQPSCPRLAEDAEIKNKGGPDAKTLVFEEELKEPHVNTGDVWEEVHRRTHMPIVADAYTHLFPQAKLRFKGLTTFDALCQAGDALGVRWKKEGTFLLARSTSFFWDKVKEVPNRYLRHWIEDRDRAGALALEDLIEMSGLTEEQLGSHTVGLGITHCWGLDEWGIIGGGPFLAGEIVPEELRKQARALRILTPAQLKQAQSEAGLSLSALSPAQREVASRDLAWAAYTGNPTSKLQVQYIPRGRYYWQPLITQAQYKAGANLWPRIVGTSREEVLNRARKLLPETTDSDITRTRGRLDILFIQPNGERIGPGGPRVLAPLE